MTTQERPMQHYGEQAIGIRETITDEPGEKLSISFDTERYSLVLRREPVNGDAIARVIILSLDEAKRIADFIYRTQKPKGYWLDRDGNKGEPF